MSQRIEISLRSIVSVFGLLAGFWVVYQIWEVVVALFISFIVISALRPLVDFLVQLRLPRTVAVLLVYITILLVFGLILGILIPPLLDQTARLINHIPGYVSDVVRFMQLDPAVINIGLLKEQIAPLSGNILRLTINIFNNILALISFLVITFYMFLERHSIERVVVTFLNRKQKEQVVRLLTKIEDKLGAWSRGELVLMTIIGVLTYFGLALLGVPFALPLAVFAGLLEIVPVIGPIVAAVPAFLVGLTTSPLLALAVTALYFIIQQIENHLLVPKVMERAVGLPPLVTILAISIGAKLMGVLGALLAVPVLVVGVVIVQDILQEKSNFHNNVNMPTSQTIT